MSIVEKPVNTDSSQGGLNVSMAHLTFPAFITIFLSVAYGIIDSWFLSKISDEAAAAVGGVFSFLAMCAFFLRSFAQAGGIVSGQHLGARQQEEVSKTFTVSCMINIGIGTVIGLLILLLHNDIGRWLGFSVELQGFSSSYLQIAWLIIVVQAFNMCYLVLMAMYGKTLWNMLVIGLLNVVNIGGNYFLLAYADGKYYSVSSIVSVSVLSQVVTLIVCAYLVHTQLGIHFYFRLTREAVRRIARAILKIGIPSSLFPVSLQLNLLALVVIITQFGADMLATQVYSVNIILLVVAWSTAVAQSAQIYISRFAGANQFEQAHICYDRCLRWGLTGVLISVGCFFGLGEQIFGMFTENATIISTGIVILLMGFILEPFRMVNLVTLASLNAVGDAKVPGLLSILLMWLVGFFLSWLFGVPLGYGLIGIYIGRIIDEIVRSIMVYRRWRSNVWQQIERASSRA